MRRTWIKLYVELLDDPKLALVPDLVRLRFIQLLLVAGEDDQDGLLPDSKRLARLLRVDHAQMLNELRALKNAGVICREGERWKVTSFAKRQAAMTNTERSQEFRRRRGAATDRATVRFMDENENDEAAAEEDATSASPSPSLSSSQGEEVQGEGDATSPDAAQPSQADPNAKTPRKRHKPVGSPRSDHDLNAGTRQAEHLLLEVAGMAALPPGEVPRIEQVAALAARYGPQAAAKELADQRQRWLKTVSEKTGKRYSPLNFSWVDWADAALGGHPVPLQGDLPPATEESATLDREAYGKLERKAVPPSPEIQAEIDRLLGRQSHAQAQP